MTSQRHTTCQFLILMLGLGTLALSIAPLNAADDAADLGKLAPDVLTKEQRKEAVNMIERDIVRRSAAVNARNREEWAKIKTREQWEKFRDDRIEKLRKSLGEYPAPPAKLNVRTTGTVNGDGFNIENVVY